MSARAAGRVGIRKLKMLPTWHIRMILMWRHPKYYKELAKKRKEFEREQANERASEQADKQGSEQASSDQASEEDSSNKR